MFPKFFEIPAFWRLPAFPVHFYGVFLALAYFGAIYFAARRSQRDGIDPERIWDMSVWVLISAYLGSNLLLVIVTPGHPISLRTGGVFYGGFVTATVVAFWYLRKHRLPFWRVADIVAPSIALGEGIGRIGCLSAGCCWGKPTDHLFGITFTSEYAHGVTGVPLNVSLWPTQLMLSVNGFLLAGVLVWLSSRRRFEGQVFWSYVLLHSITRGLIEVVRGDRDRGFVGPLSTSQAIAVATGLLAIVMLVVMARRRREAAPPDGPSRPARRQGRRSAARA